MILVVSSLEGNEHPRSQLELTLPSWSSNKTPLRVKYRQYIASPVTGRKERSNCLLAGSCSQAGGSIKALAELSLFIPTPLPFPLTTCISIREGQVDGPQGSLVGGGGRECRSGKVMNLRRGSTVYPSRKV